MSNANEKPLDNSVSGDSLGRRVKAGLVATACLITTHVLALLLFERWAIYWSARCWKVFLDQDLPLSALSVLAVQLGDYWDRRGFIVFPAIILFDGAVLLGLSLLPRWLRWMRTAWHTGCLLLLLLLFAALSYGFLAPLEARLRELPAVPGDTGE